MVKYLGITVLLLTLTFSTASEIFLSDAKAEQIVHSVGDIINIKRHGNPTTGLQWFWLTRNTYDKNVLKLLEEKFTPSNRMTFGSGGVYEWKFQALNEGRTSLAFRYSRAPEVNGDDYEYNVVIFKEIKT
jgi:predicted secreted protein